MGPAYNKSMAFSGRNGEKQRSAAVAGIFYPEDRASAEEALRSYGLSQGSGIRSRAILVPHAGWELTGALIGAAFRETPASPEEGGSAERERPMPGQVVIIGPLHEGSEEGIMLSDSRRFQTPLGDLPVNLELNEELLTCSTAIGISDIPHLYEHSIEVLLPYVKYCVPDASIVPILVGGRKAATAAVLTRSLDVVFSSLWETTLFIVSTNLSGLMDASESLRQGELFLELIRGKNGPGILQALKEKKISACGAAAAAALLDCRFMRTAAATVASRGASPDNGSGETVQYAGVRFG